MRQLLLRPIIFVTLVMGVLVLGELIAIGRLTWVNNQRIHTIETDIGKGHRLEETIFELLQLQSKLAMHKNDPAATGDTINDIQERVLALLQNYDSTAYAVSVDLQDLRDKFARAINGDSQALVDTVNLIQQVLNQQTSEEEKLLINVENDSRLELQLATLLPILLFWIGHYFFRTNVLEPLDALRDLLSGLAQGVKRPITRDTSDPVLRDLFDRYNRLVEHLIELEQEHLNYTSRLESQVRQTSHALLEQSQRLAKAERLAALTEMAASTAHELRNPLAIIQVALENIQAESADPELRDRIGLLHREVRRLTTHLNDLLSSAARNSQETAGPVDIKRIIDELVSFLSYQTSDNVRFHCRCDEAIVARLPETELRQVLLNLLQNAVQALGKAGGDIAIDAAKLERSLVITVTDNGGGFDNEFLQQGIRPFVSLKEKGSGLGLVMVQRFARNWQGSLKLENDGLGHARVALSLPLAPISEAHD